MGSTQTNTSNSIKFYENKNQWSSHTLFSANLDAGNIWLEKGRVLYHFMDFSAFENSHAHSTEIPIDISIPQALVSATFIEANRDAQVETSNKTTNYQNYFIGQNPDKWASGVYGYGQVNYPSIYEGIDLVFFENDGELKYEFHVSPFANANQIKIKYEGFTAIELSANGNLRIQTEINSQFVLVDDLVYFDLESNLITIYPNPFTNSTTLDFGKQLTTNHTIIIYDLLGQQMYNYKQFKGSSLKIEKNQLSAGVYILSLYNANNSEVFTVKRIKEIQ